jgi:hypothetical protein
VGIKTSNQGFDATIPATRRRRIPRRPCAYPWERWLTPGTRRVLTRGRDFACSPWSFLQQLRNAACRLGVGIIIDVSEDGAVFRIIIEEKKHA